MTPEETLRQLCRRYAVPAEEAGDLLPTVPGVLHDWEP